MKNSFLTTGKPEACYGCRACEQACPKSAIHFKPNKEGFLYPHVNNDLCIDCGICEKVCPYNSNLKFHKPIKAFAIQYNNRVRLLESASGGAFPVFADYILSLGGYVSGCIFSDEFIAKHIVTNNIDDVKKMSGSKYVQSDISNVYAKIRNLLKNGILVLFSGTSCQVAGLLCFLKKPYENLLTVDLICHGVPSPKLLHNYIDSTYADIVDLKFRDKIHNGWRSRGSVLFKNSSGRLIKKRITPFTDSYYNLYYLLNCVSRYSCYECQFSNSNRVADITIGDYWNIDQVDPTFNRRNGVSAILVNTSNGLEYLNKVKHLLTIKETSIMDVVAGNANLQSPSKLPPQRSYIYDMIERNGYNNAIKQECKYQYFKPFLKDIIPSSLKCFIKKYFFN